MATGIYNHVPSSLAQVLSAIPVSLVIWQFITLILYGVSQPPLFLSLFALLILVLLEAYC